MPRLCSEETGIFAQDQACKTPGFHFRDFDYLLYLLLQKAVLLLQLMCGIFLHLHESAFLCINNKKTQSASSTAIVPDVPFFV
ncbi:MAG: hypothetical protein Ct9H300mP28_17200 [Pseudomonadota bacterium]|nr:MAG: hypothetical protein Ct9H300mP28_17200 [Pseudomonadota bacterium]